MISQTQTASNQYGFYAVPKKLQPKKKYRESQYEDFYDQNEAQNQFEIIQRNAVHEHAIERDFYVDEAPYPQFKPKQRGLDYGVQIQRGDLFDFDLQVQPLLEILVGRSVVTAINQLQEEKEKQEKKQKLETYQKKRNAELMVTQRLEAKSKRKKEESQRRVLQKQVFVKNQKQLGKKVIARKQAKRCLLGLRNQVIDELQQDGYLRSQPYTNLRIGYEGWLYEQITSLIREEKKIAQQVKSMVHQVEQQNQKAHKDHIQKEKKRRQQIQDQRERKRKEYLQRKEKKRLKKLRIQLNHQREPNAIKFDQLLQKFTQLESVLKFDSRSNGFVSNATGNVVHVSGGIGNFIVALLNSVQQAIQSSEEVEELLIKIMNESHLPIEFQFSQEHYNLIQEEVQKLHENPSEYMKNKSERVSQLKEKISLSLKVLELTKTKLKSSLHQSILRAILNIQLTTTNIPKPEQQSEEPLYFPTENDRIHEELKKKLSLTAANQYSFEQLSTILRIRFERKEHSTTSRKQSESKESEEKPQDEWIDIYDGQGWRHHCQQFKHEVNRETQRPAAVNINGFEKPFVFDERALHYLTKQLSKILGVQPGPQLNSYIEHLSCIAAALKIDVPIYDGQIRMNE